MSYVDVEGASALPGMSTRDFPHLSLGRAEGLVLKDTGVLEVDAKPNPEFIYNLHYGQTSGIPGDLSQRVDPAKLKRVESEYHADFPGLRAYRSFVGFRKNAPGTMVTPAVYLQAPARITEYVGGSPDAVEQVNWTRIGVLSDGGRNGITMYHRRAFGAKDIWFAGPSAPGGFDSASLSFFRYGTTDGPHSFSPSNYMGDGARGHLLDVSYFGYRATSYRLYREGVEIPPVSSPYSSFPTFPVPDSLATYRLEAKTVLPASGTGGPTLAVRRLSPRVDTSWTFRSARGTPPPCFEGSPFHCKAESLLQINYDLRLDLFNNAPAGVQHTIAVEVERTHTGMLASLAGLRVSYSTDEGATWRDASGTTVTNPQTGFVWLRVEAWTAEGDRVVQTVQRAYGVA